MKRLTVIDSHTGGEPTRVVVDGPDLGVGPLVQRRDRFKAEHDGFRSAVVNEPRGSGVLVGALLVKPHEPDCSAGVIFFNNVGVIGMCGHGTIGLAVTMAHLGWIQPGRHRLDTPVGVVAFEIGADRVVALDNVPSFRSRKDVTVSVADHGPVTGDVAWGGNWFFLVHDHPYRDRLTLPHVEALTDFTWRVRQALVREGVTGADGGEIDHIELFGPPLEPANHGRNFVLCPGKAYDRSACGTGTSAKVACLFADGKLAEGQVWRQESVLGTVFAGSVHMVDGQLVPRIVGTAHVTAETILLFDPADPFREGIRP